MSKKVEQQLYANAGRAADAIFMPRRSIFAASLRPGFQNRPIDPSCIGVTHMDLAYIALAVASWLLVAGMAVGCAKLGGAKP